MNTSNHGAAGGSGSGWKLRLVRAVLVAAGLGLWFLTQTLIGRRDLPDGDYRLVGELLARGDAIHVATEPINRLLHEHPGWAEGLLITSSAVIDLLGIFLLAWSIFGPSLRPFLGLLILFALRQLSQVLCMLPPPEGMIWEPPGFPSLLVTYGVENDFFFSGHTAIAVYGAIEVGRRLGRRGIWLGVTIALFEATTVLVLRAHYTMDVLTGILAAFCAAALASWLAPSFDRQVERITARGP